MAAVFAENLPDAHLLRRMREMVKTGEAKERDTILVRAKEGDSPILESIRQISYPTQAFEVDREFSKEQRKRQEKIIAGWKKVGRFFPVFPGWRGLFETRSVGMMLQFTIGRRNRPDFWYLRLDDWAGNVPVGKVKRPDGGIAEARYPSFNGEKARSALPPADGQWRMLAVMSGAPGVEKKTLVFVKVDLLK